MDSSGQESNFPLEFQPAPVEDLKVIDGLADMVLISQPWHVKKEFVIETENESILRAWTQHTETDDTKVSDVISWLSLSVGAVEDEYFFVSIDAKDDPNFKNPISPDDAARIIEIINDLQQELFLSAPMHDALSYIKTLANVILDVEKLENSPYAYGLKDVGLAIRNEVNNNSLYMTRSKHLELPIDAEHIVYISKNEEVKPDPKNPEVLVKYYNTDSELEDLYIRIENNAGEGNFYVKTSEVDRVMGKCHPDYLSALDGEDTDEAIEERDLVEDMSEGPPMQGDVDKTIDALLSVLEIELFGV